MKHAYNESYLDDAMVIMGEMLDYAINDCHYAGDQFFSWFTACGLAERFGSGHSKYVAGMSGIELAQETIYLTKGTRISIPSNWDGYCSREYWAGWSLAYYQWYTGLRFRAIIDGGLTISRILSMYILHEADIRKFVEDANHILLTESKKRPTNLQRIREAGKMTQQGLSDASEVSLQMIQSFEQRQNHINKAAFDTVYSLSKALYCRPEDLMEIELPQYCENDMSALQSTVSSPPKIRNDCSKALPNTETITAMRNVKDGIGLSRGFTSIVDLIDDLNSGD